MLDIAPVVLAPALAGLTAFWPFSTCWRAAMKITNPFEHILISIPSLWRWPTPVCLHKALRHWCARGKPARIDLMTASGAAFHNEGAAPSDELAYMLAG